MQMSNKEKRAYLILCGWKMDPYIKEVWTKPEQPLWRVTLTMAYNLETTGYDGIKCFLYEFIKWSISWIKTKLKFI